MSADFFSDVRTFPPTQAARWSKLFASMEVRGDIVGPDDETLHVFKKGEPDLTEISRVYTGRSAPYELCATYVDLGSVWEELMEEQAPNALHMSSNYATLIVIDRAIAIPRGVRFLGGHAFRRVANDELAQFSHEWRGLMLRAGGAKGIARTCASWIDRGGLDIGDLTAFVGEIGTLAQSAREQQSDLLLAGYPIP